ncbi:unnamed protein product (macronuclear) [Paramecium tetraurelia]|uniref:Uncharacterized protein n=1 Tax=Paramecium tetraurelia TaxID=5888 RepID=A0DMR8_PARTE|nr:uncharacterized protein GSPATT00018539001 [Paramecium tetraurelia]CAK84335.1 unnamed protein product [Paramecium tetraurelia]|eukprot:XP_001451732.1 hypothetical protein (macronuclear) [Paramecium tetraurelia strain d4-2]
MLSYVSLNSKDSLEEFLQLYQCKDSKKKTILKKEREIVQYLKGLGLQMKTDPLLKLQRIAKQIKLTKNSFTIQNDKSPNPNDEIVLERKLQKDEDNEFNISNNPLLKRGSRKIIRTYSFENKDQLLNDNIEPHHFD